MTFRVSGMILPKIHSASRDNSPSVLRWRDLVCPEFSLKANFAREKESSIGFDINPKLDEVKKQGWHKIAKNNTIFKGLFFIDIKTFQYICRELQFWMLSNPWIEILFLFLATLEFKRILPTGKTEFPYGRIWIQQTYASKNCQVSFIKTSILPTNLTTTLH